MSSTYYNKRSGPLKYRVVKVVCPELYDVMIATRNGEDFSLELDLVKLAIDWDFVPVDLSHGRGRTPCEALLAHLEGSTACLSRGVPTAWSLGSNCVHERLHHATLEH